jgi:hypothetical protein
MARDNSRSQEIDAALSQYALGLWLGINLQIAMEKNSTSRPKSIPFSAENVINAVTSRCATSPKTPLFTHFWNMYLEF